MWVIEATASLATVAFLSSTASAISSGRHAARHGLLQMPPSFAHDGINLYPALHPEHNSSDLNHLVPQNSKELYYSQEGHRPALHGAKHAQLQATFSSPTVVLEHSSQIKDVTCSDDHIQVCFTTPEALTTVETAWDKYVDEDTFNVITYHNGCGHLTGEHRSFFRASHPIFDGDCVMVATELTDEKEVIEQGELAWGTYVQEHLSKREPVRGHVKIEKPQVMQGGTDLTKDAAAVKDFFGTDLINTDIPDNYMTGLDSLSDEEYDDLVRRGLFSWIVEGINAMIRAINSLIQKTLQAIETAAKIVFAIAAVVVNLIMVPFGVPFEQGYSADINFDHRTSGGKIGTDPRSLLGGNADNLVLSKPGAAVIVECESCGAKANFSFDGKLAFSISKGIYKAEVSFINHEAFVFDAIYAVSVEAKALKNGASKGGIKTTIEKELFAIPFFAIKIPKIITIGPQVVSNAAASVYVDASGKFRAGARFSIDAGRLVLDAVNSTRNEASGFTPRLDPIFEIIEGNIIATADLALPVGVEVALDVLGGTWKKSVGVYTAPSVYYTAGISTGEGNACNNGIEVRAGAKNRIYTSALGIWEYEFKALSTIFYETGLGCISKQGWNPKQVKPTESTFLAVAQSFGGQQYLASNATLNFTQPEPVIHKDEEFEKNKTADANKLRQLPKTNGFRLIQDAGQSATLVSGKDGFIYMANNSAEYDISAPWGGLKVKENIFSYDVFGRLIWFNAKYILQGGFMTDMGVSQAEGMPKDTQAATLTVIKADGKETYGVSFKHPKTKSKEEKDFWFPTVCKVKDGLRLYATHYLVDKDGIARFRASPDKPNYLGQMYYESDRLNHKLSKDPKDCITVRLTSDPKSTVN